MLTILRNNSTNGSARERLRWRFRIRMPNDNYCHTLTSAGSIRFGSLGAGTLVSCWPLKGRCPECH
jgi:hypothetical protein